MTHSTIASRPLRSRRPDPETLYSPSVSRMRKQTVSLRSHLRDIMKLKGGRSVFIITPDAIDTYRHRHNEHIVAGGKASRRPYLRVVGSKETAIQSANEVDAFLNSPPTSPPRTVEEIMPRRPLPGNANGFAHLLGKWPGTETDEEIAALLEEMS